jgi:hypothetical protein
MGAMPTDAAELSDYNIMEYGRGKSLEFTKPARLRQHYTAECHLLLLLGRLTISSM